MPLQSSGAISMNDMRSEFGFGSSSISANQLYRGGSYVDATQNVNNAISSVTDSGFGQPGYSQRYNFGNLSNWSFYNTNIQTKEEYEVRKAENKKFAQLYDVPFVDDDYNVDDWFKPVSYTHLTLPTSDLV